MGSGAASALVFGSSAAVLVVELVALRLLAPYLGLTLETNTLVIGLALTAIAVGSWWGGRVADVVEPRRLLGPLLLVSGVAVALTPFVLRSAATAAGGSLLVLAAAASIFVPGALLSAVTPAVTKLRLLRLDDTGTVVGRLSGIGTAGAVFGTVLTGFVLISRVPVSAIMVGLGALLALSAVAVEVRLRRVRLRRVRGAGAAAGLLALGGLGAVLAPGGCDVETTYHCAVVEDDPDRETGQVLVLDGVRHSYVDPSDPTYLDFSYIQAAASLVDTAYAADEPLAAYHLGGGGLTLPRYLDVDRPGTESLVSEIDAGVLEVDRDRLALRTGEGIDVRVEDGRLGLRRLPDDSRDLVVGDAFGGVSIPWHLTTTQAVSDVHRVLRPGGSYVANLIDHGSLAFARAEVATLREVFEHVAVASNPAAIARDGTGGNLVAVASDAPIDAAAWQAGIDGRDLEWRVITGDEVTAWVGDAEVLTDEYAPVDQLLTPYPTA